MTLLTPDNFKNNWYGWITNQWAHFVLGQMLFFFIMMAALLAGEFADRVHVLSAIAVIYIMWELATYKTGKVWDAVEDFCFVVIYGAGLVAACFQEIESGTAGFFGDAYNAFPIVGLFVAHSTFGVLFRVTYRRRA